MLVLNIFVFVCLSQNIPLFCDIEKWDISYGNINIDICPPYNPCCFHFKGNASIHEEIDEYGIYSFKNISNSWDILYFNAQNIGSNSDTNVVSVSYSYNCDGIIGSKGYRYVILSDSDQDIENDETNLMKCDYLRPQINVTLTDPNIEIYFMHGYYCNDKCSDPTPSPTIEPKIYDNTDSIHEDMCNDITKDSDWINSGNPNGIETFQTTPECPSISDKDCCTKLSSESIWIVKSYNLTLFSNIHILFSLKNRNFIGITDRTQVLYNCGIGDWSELYIATGNNTVVTEKGLTSECNNSPNVSIAFWVHYTQANNLDKWTTIGDFQICNGSCHTKSSSLSPFMEPTSDPTTEPSIEPTLSPTVSTVVNKKSKNTVRYVLGMKYVYTRIHSL